MQGDPTPRAWTPPTGAQRAAADEIVSAITAALRSDRGVHAETAIAAAARLGGTFLFRSFGFEPTGAKPGSPVLSDAANERGPLLMQTLAAEIAELGVDASRMNAGDIPDAHHPQLSVTETQARIEAALRSVADKHALSDEHAAHACALAAARLIKMCTGVLDPRVGFALAVYGFVEGSKTMPIPLPKRTAEKKSWFTWS